MSDPVSSTAPPETPQDQLDWFHSRRELSVVQATGSLALVARQLVDSAQEVWGVPGRWAPLPEGQSGLTLTASPGDGIAVNGELVDGDIVVPGVDSEAPGAISFGTATGNIAPHESGGYVLRIWDAQSEAIQNFGGIDVFPYDPAWVITARWEENPEGTTFGFEHLQDEAGTKREEVIPGRIIFTHGGTEYDVIAFKAGRALQLVFADATSGDTTYSACRFLFVAPNADGTITLDFNRAILPPCAFSYSFNCPMPPRQNRFPFAVEAGEKNVLAKDGSLLH